MSARLMLVRRLTRPVTLTGLALLGGCAPVERAQAALLEQLGRSLKAVEISIDARHETLVELNRLTRRSLDQAFDRDVHERTELSPQWVIEARKAYASAIEALATQREQSRRAVEADRRNLQTAHQILNTLRELTDARRAVRESAGLP